MPEIPHVSDLPKDKIEVLRAVTIDNLTIANPIHFTDDHCPCVEVTINGVRAGYWWLTDEAAAAFYYPDSPTARQRIMEVIKEAVDN